MPRGGARAGAGRPRTIKGKRSRLQLRLSRDLLEQIDQVRDHLQDPVGPAVTRTAFFRQALDVFLPVLDSDEPIPADEDLVSGAVLDQLVPVVITQAKRDALDAAAERGRISSASAGLRTAAQHYIDTVTG